MRPSTRFLKACRITFFTRQNCSLCANAKQTLSNIWDSRPFVYQEIDVMAPEGRSWKDLYEFDTPVVRLKFQNEAQSWFKSIHVSSSTTGEESPELASKAKKLMHRFTAEQVTAKMDEVEKEESP